MKTADILQAYLDRMAAYVLTGDFVGYVSGVALPFHLLTCSGSIVVQTHDDLRAGFDSFGTILTSHHVTDYIRLVATAVLLDERLISGHYVTHVISGGVRIMAPFPSQIVLRQDDEHDWRAVSIANGLKNARWPLDRVQFEVPRAEMGI